MIFFRKILFPIIFRFRFFFKKILTQYKYYSLTQDKNIILGKNVFINNDAKIEIRYGGKIKIGNNNHIFDGVLILSYGGKIIIGNNCNINPYTIVYGHGNTKIGNNVLIAGHCMIIPNSHNYKNPNLTIMEQGNTSKGIIIEDDVWIAHSCTILDGVTIGRGSVIAAGSVVNKSIPPYCVYGGIPAKFLKKRELKKSVHKWILKTTY